MTTPQYNRQAQAWDNKTPDESEDGLPEMGVCPWCRKPLMSTWFDADRVVTCGDETHWNPCESESDNRDRWLREEADRMRGEECDNEADRRSERGGW